jgi:hypothetical protein
MTVETAPALASFRKNATEEVRVTRSNFKGFDLVDIRVYGEFGGPAKVMMPTKKGLSIQRDQLPTLIAALQAAHGLIGPYTGAQEGGGE